MAGSLPSDIRGELKLNEGGSERVTCVQKTRGRDGSVVRAEMSELGLEHVRLDGMNALCPWGTVSRSDAVVHENEPNASSGRTQSPGDGGFHQAGEEPTDDR